MPRSIRYTLILVLFTLGTGLAAVAGWRYARTSSPVNGPIVLITIDSLRADRLPAFGYPKVPTPAIDALAADGSSSSMPMPTLHKPCRRTCRC